ncbi:phosphoglycerate dehydrogenase [Kiloniella laminariae]|uniref:D-3-phosphoglycerate dehydrogenase n=1 Tax=Kiloniella laminariae TaxID=454162 RepID=A0ABT4LI71_9PROT|nr:phosphoglycerate dehydrogenase [Kiloniella laminariae]MCZ4280796.1 phosphoglycerate dehydrogenase [Kiloniella laminariae]
MVKVLISDDLSPKAADIFRERGIDVDVKIGLSPEELIKIIGNYDGLAIRSATKVTPAVVEAATNLKVVGRAGIGVDNVNIEAASAKGVVVMNTPHGNSITTAEHAIAMMFAVSRQIPEANASTQAGKWEKSRFMGAELAGKTLGVVGCGNIGAIVADRGKGLKMKVVAFDPFLSPERAKDLGVEKVELDTLLARADFITLHVPLTDQTRGIINAEALAKTKKGVRVINCARGGLVVEDDLKAAMESGHVAGAAFDVFAVEPAKECVLFGLPNFVATPHLGASTHEAQELVALQVAEQISDYLLTGAVTNALNMPSLTAQEASKLEPYMVLSRQLGSFAGQLTRTGLKAIKIDYEGAVASLNCRPLTQTILASLLAPMMDSVNVVSAPVVARERNIDVTEAKHERDCDFQTLIRLTVTTEKGERSVAGTLFGGKRPRLVNIKGIEIEAELGKHMLYLTNEDSPGFIGALGMQLGEAGVNIATFHLGRSGPGQDAIALVELDSQLTPDQLKKVQNLAQCKQVAQLNF